MNLKSYDISQNVASVIILLTPWALFSKGAVRFLTQNMLNDRGF